MSVVEEGESSGWGEEGGEDEKVLRAKEVNTETWLGI